MRGMAKITSVIEIVKERLNPNLSIGGIVITQFDKRKTLNKSVAEIINDSFCDKVFKTIVRDNVALAEAPIKGKNVFEYNKNCNGAKDYMALAQTWNIFGIPSFVVTKKGQELGRLVNKARKTKEEINAFLATV